MTDATWDVHERRWRHLCYWSWLVPIGWSMAMGGVLAFAGPQRWQLEVAQVPLWIIMAVHLRYYVLVVRCWFPGWLWPGWILGLAASTAAWFWSGSAAALTALMAVPLLWVYGVAQQPPSMMAPRWLCLVVALAVGVRPLAVLGLLLAAWVLWSTGGGQQLPEGHQVAWWTVGTLAMLGMLLPSLVFVLLRRRLGHLVARGD